MSHSRGSPSVTAKIEWPPKIREAIGRVLAVLSVFVLTRAPDVPIATLTVQRYHRRVTPEELSYLCEERLAIAELDGKLSEDEARELAHSEVYGSPDRPGLAKVTAAEPAAERSDRTGTRDE